MGRFRVDDFLPTTVKDARRRGWEQLDVILFTGDAYVDHPSFGIAVIGRLLERAGYKVAIVPQPSWQDDLRDFRKFGAPKLFFGVSAGNMDSMVNHYTAAKRLRSDDAYTAGGKAGMRPDYAVTTYTKILKNLFPNTPVVIGGIEASLRRLTHYDYWQDKLMPSVLVDSGADILSYGMGDKTILDIAKALHNGYNTNLLRKLPQVAFLADEKYVETLSDTMRLNSYEKCLKDKIAYSDNFRDFEIESNKMHAKTLIEPTGDKFVVVNKFKGEGGKTVSSNIDFYSGFVYEMIGLPQEIYTPLFAMSRIVGWTAHRNEELTFKGKRIIRPAYKNVLDVQEYIPIGKR